MYRYTLNAVLFTLENAQDIWYSRTMKRFLGCVLLLLSCSCGKEGIPSPRSVPADFAVHDVRVERYKNCLIVQGTVTGSTQYVENIYLELEPIRDDCSTCPFNGAVAVKAKRRSLLSVLDNKNAFLIQYCPKTLEQAYRVRVRAQHTYYPERFIFSDIVPWPSNTH